MNQKSTPNDIVIGSYTNRLKMFFWIGMLILFVIVLILTDLGYVPGAPRFARGFLWLVGIAALVMWQVIFKLENSAILSLLFMAMMVAALYVMLVYSDQIFAFAHSSGLWDLFDIAPDPMPKVSGVIIEVEGIIKTGCTIEGPGSTFIANAPGQQAAEAMVKVYQANNPDGLYKVVCR